MIPPTIISVHSCDLNGFILPQKSVYHVQANRFLRNMVRAMVGTMVEVAEGRYDIDELRDVIRSGQRREGSRHHLRAFF